MAEASGMWSRRELTKTERFLATSAAKDVIQNRDEEIAYLQHVIQTQRQSHAEELARLNEVIEQYRQAQRQTHQWIDLHGGREILENDEALRASREARAEAEREVSYLRSVAHLEAVGDFESPHPAKDSIAFAGELRDLRSDIKQAIKDGDAFYIDQVADTSHLSVAKRRRLSTRLGDLALRAFNAEADAIIAAATAANEDASARKIMRSAEMIGKLLDTFSGEISTAFIELKLRELRLAVRHAAAKALERELERERRAELREQAKAERELEAERERLRKELAHYENIREAMRQKGDEEGIARMEVKLAEIQGGIEDVEQRSANIRAGYVYVISNVGAFGERMVKIGLTRRLDPMDRVRELGDASVPFGFDVHALFFSEDAVGVEAELHRRFADRRVNRVNLRREFFYTTPAQVRTELADIAGDLIEFTEQPEAAQFRESQMLASRRH